MAAAPHFFGIRHHGPGCARSLVRAFDALRPDCVLIEGPPEAQDLVYAVVAEGMRPPVALLSYCPDEPRLAVYHPFAEFSPEWQALRWAVSAGVPLRFIDLPLMHGLALDKARREAAEAEAAQPRPDTLDAMATEEAADTVPAEPLETGDPLNWLAHAAGYADGEAWWNHMVEERGDGEQLFAAIAEAMTSLRAEVGDRHRDDDEARREALREAQMRQGVRAAQKEGFERIAVVCGAWHLGALQAEATAKADQALLKGLPKLKVQTTWVPWTYRHLARASGYGAGIHSPGWYEHLWKSHGSVQPRAVGWLARVARLMREKDLDCSSAHLIEAARLADSLAALRDRPAPGLDELHEATRTVLTMGDEAVLHFIDDALVVGDRLGSVPPDVPTVPLQRDLEQLQKTLRLKPEALQKTLDLDLRNANDLARSHLLHRLNLLDVPWGTIAKVGRSSRGTFHELWSLQWQPEFVLRLIEASQWGQTLEQAATARAVDRAARVEHLGELSALVDSVLLADLDSAVAATTRALEDRAALTGDAQQLLAALPPLANVFRYGNVRQTDAAMVGHVLDGLIVRAAISLPLAGASLDDAAADALRDKLLGAHAAVGLRQGEEQSAAWRRALGQLASQAGAHELLQGVAARLLLDDGSWSTAQAAQALSLHLSSGAEPLKAAAWLDGFLNRNAVVLLHDVSVWRLVDEWLAGLSEDHFVRILPLVRRTFSAFAAGERRDLGQRASRGVVLTAAPVAAASWDESRAALPLPLLRQLLGVSE
jgi:cytochrome c1